MRSFVGGVLCALLAAEPGARAATDAPSPPSVRDEAASNALGHLLAQNDGLKSYRVGVSIAVQMRSFPYLATSLHGIEYYSAPDKFAIVFDRVPALARGFETLSGDVTSPIGWIAMDDIASLGPRPFGARTDLVLLLRPKHTDPVEHEEVSIDTGAWRVDELRWYYRNGGRISMTQDYAKVGSFDLVVARHLTIRIPFVNGGGEARYERYETNVAIAPAVFAPRASPAPPAR